MSAEIETRPPSGIWRQPGRTAGVSDCAIPVGELMRRLHGDGHLAHVALLRSRFDGRASALSRAPIVRELRARGRKVRRRSPSCSALVVAACRFLPVGESVRARAGDEASTSRSRSRACRADAQGPAPRVRGAWRRSHAPRDARRVPMADPYDGASALPPSPCPSSTGGDAIRRGLRLGARATFHPPTRRRAPRCPPPERRTSRPRRSAMCESFLRRSPTPRRRAGSPIREKSRTLDHRGRVRGRPLRVGAWPNTSRRSSRSSCSRNRGWSPRRKRRRPSGT